MTDPKPADMRHPGPARDIDLAGWLDGVGFHPANTERRQRGHELARLMTAAYATHLHNLLPPGRDKSLVFTHLEDVLFRANRALALGGGPKLGVELDSSEGRWGLRQAVADFKEVLAELDSVVPYDPRITEYEADQRGEVTFTPNPLAPMEPFEYRTEDVQTGTYRTLEAAVTGAAEGEPSALITVTFNDEGENTYESAHVWVADPEVLEGFGAYVLAMANQLRALKGRRTA